METSTRFAATRSRMKRWAAPAVATVLVLSGGAAIAHATTQAGRGVNEFGMTKGDIAGHTSTFTYTHGFYCDTTVKAVSTTGCEVGEDAKKDPSKRTEPLYITVPLGFTVKHLDCPDKLVCVDHPMVLDMTRLATALAPIYKTTPEKLLPALKNFQTPGHDHYITTKAHGRAIWWDVEVVGVTDPGVYKAIEKRHDAAFIQRLIRRHNPSVVGPIPTNLFLFFAATS